MNARSVIEADFLEFLERRIRRSDETPSEIARRAGLTSQHLRHLRAGGSGKRGPTLLTVERLASALGFRAVLSFEPLVPPAEKEAVSRCEP